MDVHTQKAFRVGGWIRKDFVKVNTLKNAMGTFWWCTVEDSMTILNETTITNTESDLGPCISTLCEENVQGSSSVPHSTALHAGHQQNQQVVEIIVDLPVSSVSLSV